MGRRAVYKKLQHSVSNSKIVESKIIEIFTEKFIRRRDIGLEYFEGSFIMMRKEFIDIVDNYDNEPELVPKLLLTVDDLLNQDILNCKINEFKDIHSAKNIGYRTNPVHRFLISLIENTFMGYRFDDPSCPKENDYIYRFTTASLNTKFHLNYPKCEKSVLKNNFNKSEFTQKI